MAPYAYPTAPTYRGNPRRLCRTPPSRSPGRGFFFYLCTAHMRRAGEYRSISGAAIRAAPGKIMPSQPEPTPRWPRRSSAGSDTARPDFGAGIFFHSPAKTLLTNVNQLTVLRSIHTRTIQPTTTQRHCNNITFRQRIFTDKRYRKPFFLMQNK